jgi:type I restriction enzyme S subunit
VEVKPGYKQSAAGVIPQDWDARPLGQGITLTSGLHVLARYCNSDGDGTPYITGPADFPNGVIRHTKSTTRPGTICGPDDILVTVKGSGAGTLVISDAEYCISRQLMAIRAHRWSRAYIYYSLLRDVSVFSAAATGLIPGLSRGDILNKAIPVPPTKAEQEAIAEALGDADGLIESLEQLIAKKRRIKQGAVQHLLTGKIRLPGFATKPGYNQTDAGRLPEDWSLEYIQNLAQITTGSKNTQDRIDDGEYPFFVRSQIIERINSYSFDGEAVLTAGDGVGTGKVFHYINGKFDTHQRVYRISEFDDRLNGYFFYLYFSTHFYHRIMQMTAKSSVDSVRREMITRMVIPVPPNRTEQEAIVAILRDMDSEIVALVTKLDKARQVKQGMMQELLTGRIRLI